MTQHPDEHGFTPGEVPCNGCRRCCLQDDVRLLLGDDAASYQTQPHPYRDGQRMLAHKPNGECIYLEPQGCSIHDRRPQQCREMDCRLIAQNLSYTAARKLDLFRLSVWRRGKDLLRQPYDNAGRHDR